MPDRTGLQVGRYRLEEKLGEGGMAEVYRAFDLRLKRQVAIKFIRGEAFDPVQFGHVLRRFEYEAEAMARLSHPNIVDVYDFGEHEGVPFIVMKYFPGGSLRQYQQRPLPLDEALRLALPVARALDYAHTAGVVHRDIKPANILLNERGEPVIADFGVAKLLQMESATQLTATGVGVGSPEYMAPEQWEGVVSPQTDIYALGVVLFELLCGKKPYTASSPLGVLKRQLSEPLPRVSSYRPDLPADVETVLFKALAKEPQDRYPSMGDFIAALEALAAGKPLPEIHLAVQTAGVELETTQTAIPPPEVALSAPAVFEGTETHARISEEPPQPSEASPPAPPAFEETQTRSRISAEPPRSPEAAPLSGAVSGQKAQPPKLPGLLGRLQKLKPRWKLKQALVGGLAVVILGALSLLTITFLGVISLLAAGVLPSQPERVYFTSSQAGKPEIYLLDSDGQRKRVTHTPGDAGSWSPALDEASRLYFNSDRDGKTEIYRLEKDGRLTPITRTPGAAESWDAVLSPQGMLYFNSDRGGKVEIYRIEQDGRVAPVTHSPGDSISWGARFDQNGVMYFNSNRSGKTEIYRLEQDGKLSQVTHTPGWAESWNACLEWRGVIHFQSNRDQVSELYRMNQDGRTERVTHSPKGSFSAGMQVVAGTGIYFTSNRNGKLEIYRIEAESGKTVRVTNSAKGESWLGNPQPAALPR